MNQQSSGQEDAICISGVFDSKHIFELETLGDHQTRLTNRVVCSGILSPIFRGLPMIKEAPASFDETNREIKAQVGKV